MIKKIIQSILKKMGYRILPIPIGYPFGPDMEQEFKSVYRKCKPHTMTSLARMYSLYKATQYIIKNDIPGDIVECGVWKGGSMMVSALTLLSLKETSKKLYLYDTYEGMSAPTEKDVSNSGLNAAEIWKKSQKNDSNDWCFSSLDEVKKNLHSTKYPENNMIFIKGKVEDTIPENIPKKISLLRLDTDWFDSTYHELIHLFPLLSDGGVIIIDDYGFWKGSREAVDKYFSENGIKIFLNRIDNSSRLAIK